MLGSRLRALGMAAVVAFGLMLGFRQLGCQGAYSGHAAYRAQVEAFLAGRLALTEAPEGLAHDLAWTPSGVHQVWGLGVPLWLTPFEAGARAVGADPFPDRVAMGLWLVLMMFVLFRAFRARDGEPWWIGAGSVLVTALLPAVVTMLRGRLGVYEEAALYSYGAAMILLGGLVLLVRYPSGNRYLLLLLAAGLAALIRPTVVFYGLATAVLASAIYLRAHGRRVLPIVALGVAVFAAGGSVLYTTNAMRFGSGTEFGHRQNLQSLAGNIYATRFGYPFERAGLGEAALELAGAMFDRPEAAAKRGFYHRGLHRGEADLVRWREYYFTTYSWAYVPLLLAGVGLGVRAWRRRRREGSDRIAPWLLAWAVIGAAPLVAFYLRAPFLSSRYLLDLGPAIAALLVIAWRESARSITARQRGALAFAMLVALWATALATSKTRGRVPADPTDRATAAASSTALAWPVLERHTLPGGYDLDAPQAASWIASAAEPRPHGLYLNGIGWDAATGRVAPAIHLFVDEPRFVELDVQAPLGGEIDWSRTVRVATGLHHLRLARVEPAGIGWRLRFEPTAPLAPGLHVVFLAFGPDTELDRAQTDFVLRSVRWAD